MAEPVQFLKMLRSSQPSARADHFAPDRRHVRRPSKRPPLLSLNGSPLASATSSTHAYMATWVGRTSGRAARRPGSPSRGPASVRRPGVHQVDRAVQCVGVAPVEVDDGCVPQY